MRVFRERTAANDYLNKEARARMPALDLYKYMGGSDNAEEFVEMYQDEFQAFIDALGLDITPDKLPSGAWLHLRKDLPEAAFTALLPVVRDLFFSIDEQELQ
jgi:hypothetical protein